MNSLITLRWNQGGRKVCSATIQRGGKITKSQLAVPGDLGGRGQHGEDRRVGMVEADRAHRVEAREIVFVRRVIAVPGDDVERRVVESVAHRLPSNLATTSNALRRGPRRPRPGPGNRADWRARWRRSAPVPAGGTARRNSRRHSRAPAPSGSSTRNLTPRGMTRDLARRRLEHAEFGAAATAAPAAARSASRRRHR